MEFKIWRENLQQAMQSPLAVKEVIDVSFIKIYTFEVHGVTYMSTHQMIYWRPLILEQLLIWSVSTTYVV